MISSTVGRASTPYHRPWNLTDEERRVYRITSQRSREAKLRALAGEAEPVHEINVPLFDPGELMPVVKGHGLRALSLFSGGGGLDLGFDRAGYTHAASFEVLADAGRTLQRNRPLWDVFGGADGDVTQVDWPAWRGAVDVIHGGPPCQPFSVAGRQDGHRDGRDMFPEFVRAVEAIEPLAFVAENVAALGGPKFREYLNREVLRPLGERYQILRCDLRAELVGIPQHRRRLVLVGIDRRHADPSRYVPPMPTHRPHVDGHESLLAVDERPMCVGTRRALGLQDIGHDAAAPTIRSSLTGPRHTTSVLNSVSSRAVWEWLRIWPNGVAPTRKQAQAFPPENGHFRLAVPDVALLQGFPDDWRFEGAVYMQLGQIGNAVPPPLAYSIACSVASALH